MHDEQQFEQLILQYNHLKNGAEEINRLIQNDNYDDAITLLKSRESMFLNCKCMRNYLELTDEQKEELESLLDELRTLEIQNIKLLEKNMDSVRAELKTSIKTEKLHQAYDFDENISGTIINYSE